MPTDPEVCTVWIRRPTCLVFGLVVPSTARVDRGKSLEISLLVMPPGMHRQHNLV